MKSFIKLFAIIITITLNSCGSVDAEDTLCQAERDLQGGKIEQAVTSCNILTDTTQSALSSTQMCRVAIIYAKASEMSDNQDYMATATKCYECAVSLDSNTDSLYNYIESLDVESQSVVRVIREVSRAMNSQYDYTLHSPDDEDEAYMNQLETTAADAVQKDTL